MSLPIRVELPTYSHSFQVSVPSIGTIDDVKREIEKVCAGNPRVYGQRLIWRGRFLGDDEKVLDVWKVRRPLPLPSNQQLLSIYYGQYWADSRRMSCPSCIFQSTHQLGPAHPLASPQLQLVLVQRYLRSLRPRPLLPHRLIPARAQEVTFLLPHHPPRPHNLVLRLALLNPGQARRHLRPFQRLHRFRVLPQFRLDTSTLSLINTSAPRPS